jgi:hypothetical protein
MSNSFTVPVGVKTRSPAEATVYAKYPRVQVTPPTMRVPAEVKATALPSTVTASVPLYHTETVPDAETEPKVVAAVILIAESVLLSGPSAAVTVMEALLPVTLFNVRSDPLVNHKVGEARLDCRVISDVTT